MRDAGAGTGATGDALKEMRPFLVLWIGQVVSALGSGLTSFAVPVEIFRITGSAERFGLLLFAATVPGLLISPYAGALVDRWDRRKVLIATDTGAAITTLVLAWIFATGNVQLWQVMAVVATGSALSAFQEPAFGASVSMLVPPRHFARASGLMQSGTAIAGIVTPIAGGTLVLALGIHGVLLIDVATFLIAAATLLLIRIPRPPRAEQAGLRTSLTAEAAEGLRFIAARRGLLGMLAFFALLNLGLGIATTLLHPLVLSFTTPAGLGVVAACAAVGTLLGGMAMGATGGPKRRMTGVFGGSLWLAVCLMAAGLRPSVAAVAVSLLVMMVMQPVIVGSAGAVWMAKTPQGMQGRVFAVRKMLALSTFPVATLVAGPLAERVFEPAMAPGGAFASVFGALLGTGPGRGIGLLYLALGAALAAVALAFWAVPAVRRVDEELPDAVAAAPASPDGDAPADEPSLVPATA